MSVKEFIFIYPINNFLLVHIVCFYFRYFSITLVINISFVSSIFNIALFVIFTALAWHPIHESLFTSGGSDGCVMFWVVGYV